MWLLPRGGLPVLHAATVRGTRIKAEQPGRRAHVQGGAANSGTSQVLALEEKLWSHANDAAVCDETYAEDGLTAAVAMARQARRPRTYR